MTRISVCILLLALVAGCSRGPNPQGLPKAPIEIGGARILVEIARTPDERATGMMHRRSIGPDEGMLFIFPHDQKLAFYMKNTHAPLSIAFISSDGVIVNIAHMQPLTLETHSSRVACRYALEMPAGWFEKRNVSEGARVTLPDATAAE